MSLPVPSSSGFIPCKPFLKWVGGKTQLLPEIHKRLPKRFNRYFEPFVGGGAVYFSLQPSEAFLNDVNSQLIECYEVVRDNPIELVSLLKKHKYEEEYFYNLRDKDRSPYFARWKPTRKAARLIYLNKTCFNGLYRVNSKGQFNAPFGRYTNPLICDETNLLACSEALRESQLTSKSFIEAVEDAKRGDFVYFDPPYAPLSATSYFTSYSKDGFDTPEQIALRDLCVDLDKRGVRFMASNSSAPLILDLYKKFNLKFVRASRSVNSVASKRGKIDEVLVTNYE